jgi:Fic family protein
MHSLATPYLDKLVFTVQQATMLKAIGEYRGKQELYTQQTPQILDSLKIAAMIESVESSNRLEGITAARDRIEALVLKPTTLDNRSEEEIAGYRDALERIHGQAEHLRIDTNTILQFHAMINRYTTEMGGRWKRVDNVILERYKDGTQRVRFRPVPAAKTPSAMAQLIDCYNMAIHQDRREPLIVIPLTVLDFLCIHPFEDGNGRCSRLLTLLLLYHFGYEVGRYISLERVFEQSKVTYYETLETSSRKWHEGQHDPYPWLNYFWGVLIAAYKEFEKRVGTIQTARGSKTELVRAAVGRRIGPFAISDIERDCPGVSREMVRVVLNQLRDKGAIELSGKGRGARWGKRQGRVGKGK